METQTTLDCTLQKVNETISHLTFCRYRITFRASKPIVLPDYSGSAFRGCLGEALLKEVCQYPTLQCEECNLKTTCPFARLYHSFTEPSHFKASKFSKSPHPYLLVPESAEPVSYRERQTFHLDIVLIGSASELTPLILYAAINLMGKLGVGVRRGKFEAINVEYLDSSLTYKSINGLTEPCLITPSNIPLPPSASTITLQFEHAVRMLKDKKVLNTAPSFGFFIDRVASRLCWLANFHCGAEYVETHRIFETVSDITTGVSALEWKTWERYSGTQKESMRFDGIVGTANYEGNFAPWMPLLTMGSWLHVGSTATFGMGKYSIQSHGRTAV